MYFIIKRGFIALGKSKTISRTEGSRDKNVVVLFESHGMDASMGQLTRARWLGMHERTVRL